MKWELYLQLQFWQCELNYECGIEYLNYFLFFRNNMRAAANSTPQYETEYNPTQQYVQVEMPSPDDQQFVIYTS